MTKSFESLLKEYEDALDEEIKESCEKQGLGYTEYIKVVVAEEYIKGLEENNGRFTAVKAVKRAKKRIIREIKRIYELINPK